MRILHIVTAFPRFPNDIISPWLVEMLKRLRAAGHACGARMVTSWYGVELRWVKSSLPWLKRFLVWALRTSDQVVAISSATAREITNVVPVSVRVIPYTVGFPETAAGPSLPRAGDSFLILFVGSLVERKGVRYLIDALPLLPAQRHAKLVIIGDGAERSRLEAQVRERGLQHRVEVRGRVAEQELRRAYAAASVLVLPAIVDARGDTEGLGVVLLEAMSYGVPVIGSDLGGITDIVVDGQTGLLVPPQDSAALAAALERLATDRDLARRLGEAGAGHVRRHFSWPAIIAQWEECYLAVLDPGRASA